MTRAVRGGPVNIVCSWGGRSPRSKCTYLQKAWMWDIYSSKKGRCTLTTGNHHTTYVCVGGVSICLSLSRTL